jgi:hypothetical protein
MSKFELQKIEVFAKLLNNSLKKKIIIVLIGRNGSFLTAFNGNKIIAKLLIPFEMQGYLDQYKGFFQQFRKFHIFFLLDSPECKILNELVPTLQSIVKVNPVEKFIAEHFPKEDIVAYNVYNITTKNSETWNTMLASAPYQPPLSTILEYILENFLKFGGIYFLALEFKTIIDRILEKTNNSKYLSYLQIFVSILDASGIKCVVKHSGHVIAIKTIEYPVGKSNIYVQGLIEQEVTDHLISFKNHISHFNLKVCIIFLVDKNLNLLLHQSTFDGHQVICISDKELFESKEVPSTSFSDSTITELFAEQKSFLGLNQTIKTLTTLNFVNAVMFKPLIAIIILILFILSNIKFTTLENQRKTLAYYKQSYQITNKYNNIRQKFPYIHNEINSADLYSLESLLKMETAKPFDQLEKLLSNLEPSISVGKIRWELRNHNNLIYPKEYVKIDFLVKFIDNDISIDKASIHLDVYINRLKESFKNFDVSYVKFLDKALSISGCTVIPVAISITGPQNK